MGVYDSLYVQCNCGKDVEFQSKAGACVFGEFVFENVPALVAADMIGESRTCECGTIIRLRGTVILQQEQVRTRSWK